MRQARGASRRRRSAELGVIDYTLAKRALIRDARRGLLSVADICDAHPELMRAAKHVGEATTTDCPVCGPRVVSGASWPRRPADPRRTIRPVMLAPTTVGADKGLGGEAAAAAA